MSNYLALALSALALLSGCASTTSSAPASSASASATEPSTADAFTKKFYIKRMKLSFVFHKDATERCEDGTGDTNVMCEYEVKPGEVVHGKLEIRNTASLSANLAEAVSNFGPDRDYVVKEETPDSLRLVFRSLGHTTIHYESRKPGHQYLLEGFMDEEAVEAFDKLVKSLHFED